MAFVSCPDREKILSATGHVVVTGGPGCGKTTVALRKAMVRIESGLKPAQRVLFLSFSRAAVARIIQAARGDLPRDIRSLIDIQTFHSLCWHFVRAHGYLLGAPTPIRLLAPHDERTLRDGAKDDDPEWNTEKDRLFHEEGQLAFDLFAPKALDILRRSVAHRKLMASRYPMIIVDEAQDTGNEQWACIELLAEYSQLVCLADLDQQIYDFRKDVSPERLKQIMTALMPLEVNLGGQNNRSPGAEIVKFGNDVLASTPRGSSYRGVSHSVFGPAAAVRDKSIRVAVGRLRKTLKDETGIPAESIGFLTRSNRGVATVARALQGGDDSPEIPHRVHIDEAEVFLATRVIALCLEPIENPWATLAVGLELISELYRARGNAKKTAQLVKNIADAKEGRHRGNAKCPKSLKAILDDIHQNPLSGHPGNDWLRLRRQFGASGTEELELVAERVIYLMALNRGRRISDALASAWLGAGRYVGARAEIEAAITQDQILGGDNDLRGLNVMTIHKSKGKEFDGVIILHLGNVSALTPSYETPPHVKSRRLFRVGITRARRHVHLLEDASNPSPLLQGHKLNITSAKTANG